MKSQKTAKKLNDLLFSRAIKQAEKILKLSKLKFTSANVGETIWIKNPQDIGVRLIAGILSTWHFNLTVHKELFCFGQ